MVFAIANLVQASVTTDNKHMKIMIGQIKLIINHSVILIAIDSIIYNWTETVGNGLKW